MSKRHAWTALILVGLTGCALEPDPSMALACQTTKCVCTTPNWSFTAQDDPPPILWRLNGDAYCPEGYVLQRAG